VKNEAMSVPGAPRIPLSARQQLSEHPQSLPRYNEILIGLERARVQSERSFQSKTANQTMNAYPVAAKKVREGTRPDVLNVLIASPSDVSEEREAVVEAIHDWNAPHARPDTLNILLNPIRWETHSYPESGDRPQALLNRQIVELGDILIGIFGARIGTPTGAADSGSIEEIEQFRKAGKYVALYFSNAPVPRDADRQQLDALESYREARMRDTKYEMYSNAADLRRQVTQHLTGIATSVAKPLQIGMWRSSAPTMTVTTEQKSVAEVIRDEMKQAEAARLQAQVDRDEAARWTPVAAIESRVEGPEQVNNLILKSPMDFALSQVSLVSPSGAKVHDYDVHGEVFSKGFSVPITHASLTKIANNSPNYFNFSTFEGSIRYSVVRQKDAVQFSGELKFHAEMVIVNSTVWFRLSG
jgi:hypothetical protein